MVGGGVSLAISGSKTVVDEVLVKLRGIFALVVVTEVVFSIAVSVVIVRAVCRSKSVRNSRSRRIIVK